MLGNTDISSVGSTVTGAISNLGNKGRADLLQAFAASGTFSSAHSITDYSLILVIPKDVSGYTHESITVPTDYIKDNYGNMFTLNNYNTGTPYFYITFNNASSVTTNYGGYVGYIYTVSNNRKRGK